jgi:hypothetical protein
VLISAVFLFRHMKYHLLFLISFSLFVQATLLAQKKETHLKDSLFKKYTLTSAFDNKSHYYVCEINTKTSLPIQIIRKLTDQLAIVRIPDQNMFAQVRRQTLVVPANDFWKLSPPLEKGFLSQSTSQKFTITALNIDTLVIFLRSKLAKKDILSIDRASHSVVIKCTSLFLHENVLGLNEVIFIDLAKEAHSETAIIGYDRSFHGINEVDYLIPNANGKNIVAGVKEQKMDENDIDLWKRVLHSSISASNTTYHATTIASIIGGAGNSFYYGRGIAWGCKFFPSSFANLFADDSSIIAANRVTIQNHSYGTVVQQFYGAEALSYDAITWSNKTFIPVFSSGNQGDGFASEGMYANIPGYANLTGNFKMAKNIITVGAIDMAENVAVLSSAGPLYDGRLAPQLVALGPSGTSDAAAIVSGTVAVIQQVYADSNNNVIPPASLVKAILYNTAENIYKPGIDFKTGYGLLNSYSAVRAIQQKNYDGGILLNGQEWTKNISIPVNTAELKVTLSWTDTAATVNNNKALINDLDLEVREMNSGLIYQPWVLNPDPKVDSLSKVAIRKRDSLNTSEQVSITLPAAGIYQLKVKANSVINSFLPFHVAYKIDTVNTFTFTSPLHASDVIRSNSEPITVRWSTYLADTNQTGNLYISYNDGASWNLVVQGVKLISRKYQSFIKDTNSMAVLKMETGFGNFLSKRFIISRVVAPQLDFNCADSFRLSWNKHIYANAYRIFSLTDSAYLKPIITITDTFYVFEKAVYPSLNYAVEPILANGLPAARSVVVNIELQGVKCFYKSLNYNLLDTNRVKLILELSTISYADSVFFEQVTASGQTKKIYGSAKVNTSNFIYDHLVNELTGGVTYVRARIKLKNGVTVFTDIVPILTSGQNNIWFYPNPVTKNNTIKYILKQGVPADSPLQLFDIYGRLIRNYASLPKEINISNLPSGIVIYRLLDDNNKTLETGKLIIQ